MPPREITPSALATRLGSGQLTLLVDVREPWEHARVALTNSRLLPLGELARRHAELAPPPNALVVTYCHHGVRSADAAEFLTRIGWPEVVSLAGGIDAWSREIDPSLPRY